MRKLLEFVIGLLPVRAEFCKAMGIMLHERGCPAGAQAFLARAAELAPDDAETLVELGNVNLDRARYEAATDCFLKAMKMLPKWAVPLNNLGVVCLRQGLIEQAEVWSRRALALDPGHVDAMVNLAQSLEESGKAEDALRYYRSALERNPEHAEARFSLALEFLKSGRWIEGWREYEWRFSRSPAAQARLAPPVPGLPRWHGESLSGKAILLRSEQGAGDSIQFCRFAPALAEAGADVYLSVPPRLVRLMRTLDRVKGVCPIGKERRLGSLDFWSPLLSVPRWLETTQDTIPGTVPYLSAGTLAVERWSCILAAFGTIPRVGLAWKGNPHYRRDRSRSLPIQQLAVLARTGCTFVSLQSGAAAADAPQAPSGMVLVSLGKRFEPFEETAAVMANLDLVVTVDTAVAHLAGALGRPVWTLLEHDCDWRWLRDRSDAPWYPTMRLYRQRAPGDWDEVLERVAEDLMNFRARATGTARANPAQQ